MILSSDFKTFLSKIRLTPTQKEELKNGHTLLRSRLNSFEELQDIFVSDFLQGSYRRHTAVRPKNGKRSDVDIIVVTKLHESEYSPEEAMNVFTPFLDKYYEGKYERQGRSIGIALSAVEFDLVLTSAPSASELEILKSAAVTTEDTIEEAFDWKLHPAWLAMGSREANQFTEQRLNQASSEQEWKTNPLRIPNCEAQCWKDTHPLEQIKWTRDKNHITSGHFINVVKAIKWWRLTNYDEPKHPKGFPLERIVGDCCPDDIDSVADGVVRTLETIVSKYKDLVDRKEKPTLPDYGVPDHDVLARMDAEDFCKFYEQSKEAALLARHAFDSTDRVESGKLWQQLLGKEFPDPPENGGNKSAGYTNPIAPASPDSGRFA